ncbi:hypothetical protein Taro_049932 [Colocasia esculenta]|uniref:N-acetyltransferase domain-containing protein n=1 Tax=Colocasia esculenta TaxID=4460 RepID=A0A843XCC3_COLES|nr:hypothetical protein [Colocasia esculenta]
MAETEVPRFLLKEEEEQQQVTQPSEEVKAASPTEISLRTFELSDLDDYMVWASDKRVTRFCSWDAYTSKDDLLKYMTETVLPHPWFRAVCVDGRPVGAISVALNSGNDRCRGMLGYVLAFEHWGRGIMTRAVRMAAVSVFRELPELERVEALVDVENVASQRVVEKAGFLREGVLRKYLFMKGRSRDMVIYSFLATDQPPAT